ncbi:MAG TPA: hypothetical protein PLU19_12380, partial [Dermatophilaceae bacterium]|nr:hypothetical protein [Dermatophilaceae bacterium]
MQERHLEPLGIATAGMAWLSIGVVELIGLSDRASNWWWLAYLGYGAAYLWCVVVAPKGHWPRRERAIALGVVTPLGVAVVALSSSSGFTSISLVMTAILLANLVSVRVVVGIVLVQTLAVVALLWTTFSDGGMAYAVSTGVAFFAFQLFAL